MTTCVAPFGSDDKSKRAISEFAPTNVMLSSGYVNTTDESALVLTRSPEAMELLSFIARASVEPADVDSTVP
jgi:hypothetical protein